MKSPFRLFFSHSISLSVCWSVRQIGSQSVREFSQSEFRQLVSYSVDQSAGQGVRQQSIQLGSQSVDAVSQSVSQSVREFRQSEFRQLVSYSVDQSAGQGVRQQTGRQTFSQSVS